MALSVSQKIRCEVTSPPCILQWIGFTILIATTFVAYKFSAEVIGILAIASLLTAYLTKRNHVFALWRVLSLAWFVSLMLTIDVAIRSSDSFSVKLVPVFGRVQTTRAQSMGLLEDRDFLVYERISFPIPTKSAILINFPSKKRIETPTLWFFGKFL